MASNKDKKKGPRPAEIAIAAVLSLIVGLLGAAVFLAMQPPTEVSEIPDDREFGVVYYVAGTRGGQEHGTWQAKRLAVEQRRTGEIRLIEQELNLWAMQEFGNTAASDDGWIELRAGTPSFRIEEQHFQIGAPLDLGAFGNSREFRSHAVGGFAQRGGVFVFEPERVYIGSMPVPNLFGLSERVLHRVVSAYDIPEGLREGWASLQNVFVEDGTLHLVIP